MARSTINDVAERAGVSVATVSRALRQLPNVSAATRTRVLEAAHDLAYSADSRASSLASGRTNIIAVAAPDFGAWYVGQTIVGVETALATQGLDLLVLGISRDSDSHVNLASRLAGRRVDGLLLIDFFLEEEGREFLLDAIDVPIVVTGERIDGITSLAIDNHEGGRLAAQHLIELGHERIAFVGGAAPAIRPVNADLPRKTGACAALEHAGLELWADLEGRYSVEGGRMAFDEIHAMGDQMPSAIFCGSDEMAVGLISRAMQLGFGVPEDFSVIGFDDHEMAEPLGLTTVRQEVVRNGACAVDLLLEEMEGSDGPTEHTAALTLVPRTTTNRANVV